MRAFQGDEQAIAQELITKAEEGHNDSSKAWEWLAAVDAATHKKLDLRTDNWNNAVHLGAAVDDHIAKGGQVVVHHNHITQHSLSGGDWRGMCIKPAILENWLYTWDGTTYWGRVRPEYLSKVLKFCEDAGGQPSPFKREVETRATILSSQAKFSDPDLAPLIDNAAHLVNKDMRKWGWVEYEYSFGSYMDPIVRKAG